MDGPLLKAKCKLLLTERSASDNLRQEKDHRPTGKQVSNFTGLT